MALRILKPLMFIIIVMFSTPESSATHFMGGEITWECTPQGNFRFTLILYRECYTMAGGGSANFPTHVNINSNAPGFSSIAMTRISLTDISPVCGCPGGPSIYCTGLSYGAANMGAIQKNVYTSDAAYPDGVPLTGVPPDNGWYFGYSVCCRNPSSNLVNATGNSFFVRARMYPYNNTPVNTCFDNSPVFMETPSSVICSGYSYAYNHVAIDKDMDSLSFEWAPPLRNSVQDTFVTFSPGYTYESPLPGTLQNPNNVAAVLDTATGAILFTSYTNGAFLIVVKVTSYKDGIMVSEIFRELQIILVSCGINEPPDYVVPLPVDPTNPYRYIDTITAGSLITFPISALDLDHCNDSANTPQNVLLQGGSYMFDSLINPGGCPTLPCAGLSPSPGLGSPLVAPAGLMTQFSWQTSPGHLKTDINGYLIPTKYDFFFEIADNFCPVPFKRNIIISFVLMPAVVDPFPMIRCLSVDTNGDVTIEWMPPANMPPTLSGYTISSDNSPSWQHTISPPLDTVNSPYATSYKHVGANADSSDVFYRIAANYSDPAPGWKAWSQTARPIRLNADPGTVGQNHIELSWNHTLTDNTPGYSGVYEVYRMTLPNSWQLIHTTGNLNYSDIFTSDHQQIEYIIMTENTFADSALMISNCYSVSNVAISSSLGLPDGEESAHRLRIFPNPGTGHFTLECSKMKKPSLFTVYTITGQLVFSGMIFIQDEGVVAVDLSHLAAGTYIAGLHTDKGFRNTRLVITP